ncbi:hypothetical protein ElyMa_001473500 [Elysia marginata]|uniref:Uncharacterized protein n=1 Tax=Elysia marginata TaxID=1093978 RepID=A0AAV4J4Q3_9GAST|nr:hypothetical protein ElyMa_001473500 [Elysia marginata]
MFVNRSSVWLYLALCDILYLLIFTQSENKSHSTSKVKLPKITSGQKKEQESSRKSSLSKFSRWKLIKTMVKGDYIGQEWVDLNTGPFNPPDEEMSLVSDGCEVIMMHRDFLIKYLRKEL